MIFEIVAEGAEWTVILQADADFGLPQVIDSAYVRKGYEAPYRGENL